MIKIEVMGLYVCDRNRRLTLTKAYVTGTEAYMLIKLSNRFSIIAATADAVNFMKVELRGEDMFMAGEEMPIMDEYQQAIAVALSNLK